MIEGGRSKKRIAKRKRNLIEKFEKEEEKKEERRRRELKENKKKNTKRKTTLGREVLRRGERGKRNEKAEREVKE